ncbi:hypothetical protein WJX72_002730 [[Myrmecia] bisecta]|uniref:NADH:ubiquinone reductase (non-electrogenic) n=1 Tax=[Myrmecia] bisecta TaxID=41462 RepID=A0AAW1QAD3_9CHLO
MDVTVISPRNHMVFTPLLTSTCVGTVEPRSVAIPIINIQRGLRQPQNVYYCSECIEVHPQDKLLRCRDEDGVEFAVGYDVLAIATGSQGSTFGISGVKEYTHPLRNVADAESIRNSLIANWSKANTPGRDQVDRLRLLHVVVVGGGPTGVEFAGEISDFMNTDLRRIDPERARDMRVTLVEAQELLGSFDTRLREYAARKLHKQGVHLIKGAVKQVEPAQLTLADGQRLPYGLCVWSTGVGPTEFTTALPFARTPRGRVAVNDCLEVLARPDPAANLPPLGPSTPGEAASSPEAEPKDGRLDALVPVPGVYALGDCCANVKNPLPALAQVAEQQGHYLAKRLNQHYAYVRNGTNQPIDVPEAPDVPFVYHHLGSMATVGDRGAVVALGSPEGGRPMSLTGIWGLIAWRSAYLTRLATLRNRIYVALNWTTTLLFGRDVSRW